MPLWEVASCIKSIFFDSKFQILLIIWKLELKAVIYFMLLKLFWGVNGGPFLL